MGVEMDNPCGNTQASLFITTTELITVEIQKYLESEMDSKRRICNSLELSTAYPQVGKLPQNAFSS